MIIRRRSVLAAGALAMVAGLGLTACATGDTSSSGSGSDSASDTTTLTVWVDQFTIDALTELAKDYTDKTGVEVKFVDTTSQDVRPDFIQKVPTGKGPDITIGAHDWAGELVKNGVIAPLELGASLEDFLPIAQEASQYDGKTYMLPFAVESIALLRNVDIAPTAPATFDEMVASGKFVVQQGDAGDPYHLYPFQTSFGAPVFGLDDNGGFNAEDLQLGNAGGVEFANWLAAKGQAGVLDPQLSYDLAKEQFLNGTAAYWLTGPWSVAAVKEAGMNFSVDVIPTAGPNVAAPFAGVKSFFLNAESKNKVAATDFLVNFLATEDVQLALHEANGILPANAAAAEAASSDPIVAGFKAVGDTAVPMPAIPEMASVWSFWGTAEVGIIGGAAEPTPAWEKLTSDVQGAIAG